MPSTKPNRNSSFPLCPTRHWKKPLAAQAGRRPILKRASRRSVSGFPKKPGGQTPNVRASTFPASLGREKRRPQGGHVINGSDMCVTIDVHHHPSGFFLA